MYARRAVADVESEVTDTMGDSDSSKGSVPSPDKFGYLYYIELDCLADECLALGRFSTKLVAAAQRKVDMGVTSSN